ncbi:hypothetical protein BDY19DRAFT_971110 [Irpex rosettiformis]|uniref:Uncharacterized protein n=1 Tax=Irpex rosettiformis TaxID=378272 RepID=A0ACB8TR95_9APHY|nr:hypothetical protein BDY19DRAFT_971110 [Irpex rosettiformis]
MASLDYIQPHPFFQYLDSLLTGYESSPYTPPMPKYDGPTDQYTASIIRSIENIARRMITAEGAVRSLEASHNSYPETKKAHSVDDVPPLSSLTSSSSPPVASKTTDSVQPSLEPPSPDIPIFTETTDPSSHPTITHASSFKMVSTNTLGGNIDNAVPASTFYFTPTVPPDPPDESMIPSAVEELRYLMTGVQHAAKVCNAISRGDLSHRITVPCRGVVAVQLREIINYMVECLARFAEESTRVYLEVNSTGSLSLPADEKNMEGTWLELIRNVNQLCTTAARQPPLSSGTA